MSGSIYKRCGCKAPVLDQNGAPVLGGDGRAKRREVGAACPKLKRADGRWNPAHGSWHFLLEVPTGEGQRRQHIRQGGHPTSEECEKAMGTVQRLLELAEQTEEPEATRERIAELVRAAIRARRPLPDYDELRKNLILGRPVDQTLTVGQWLSEWLASKDDLRGTTKNGYESHIRVYLIPHLGNYPLARLRAAHIKAMFDAITDQNQLIDESNATRRAMIAASKKAWREHDAPAARAARAAIAAMPPYRRKTGAATCQRIRATLRSALSDAIEQELISINVAKHVHLASGKAPRPRIWTAARIAAWRKTGEKPSPSMVWTIDHTTHFLQTAREHPLFPLYQLIIHSGMRRGEACGLRWADLDLDTGVMTINQQIVQIGWDTTIGPPKSEAGERPIPLDPTDIELLHAVGQAQKEARAAFGQGWLDTDLVFTGPGGLPLHPSHVTDTFTRLAADAGLPPIRLHDLRHGAATHALATGKDIKALSQLLGHATTTITRDLYQSVVDELLRDIVTTLAGLYTTPTNPPAAVPGDTARQHPTPANATDQRGGSGVGAASPNHLDTTRHDAA